MATAKDYLGVDYCREVLSSIKLVQDLVSERRVQLHPRQCDYLSSRMRDTGSNVTAKLKSLVAITSGDDIRRKALRHLHSTVKRAEMLVRGCCCEWDISWLQSAVALVQIKEDVVDLVLDLRWWTSMVDIAIANVTWMTSGGKLEQENLDEAEKDFQTLLDELKSADNKLDQAFVEDKQHLLQRVRNFLGSFSGRERTLEYLLASHLRTRLENTDLVESMSDVELNAYKIVGFIGHGSFGSVLEVEWLKRSCALKLLEYRCTREAASLSSFHHPHIVQFLRYWEAPRSSKSGKSFSRGSSTAMGGSPSPRVASDEMEEPTSTDPPPKSHILMELLPTDLLKHMGELKAHGTNALPQDVMIDVMLQITKAMCHLNNCNVAHRDLKPNNILAERVSSQEVPELAARGYLRVKLGDFGLVNTKALSIASRSTAPRMVGAKVYTAPEVYVKDSILPRQSTRFPRLADVWSFGMMFSEVLSGQSPFPEEQNRLGELHTKIQGGARPPLPRSCPEYLRFCITQCWQLRPQDRPSFADLWKLMRFAQVRSLGIIREDHDFFRFTTREGVVKRLHKQKVPPLERGPNSSRSVLSIFVRILLFVRRRSSRIQTSPNFKRLPSKAGSSTVRVDDKPLGYLVNLVGPQDVTWDSSKRDGASDESKVDVIFFEGNVGRKKYLSCKDTWVQRGDLNVWWPRDWLQKDLNGDARILLLEYIISEKGVKGVVDELQRLFVFSDQWNRGHTWNRPIVLVGHSLGCVVIEQLVLALNERAESLGSLEDEFEANRARLSKAFLASLAGCFFYAPPLTGLMPNEDLLKYVFGGLSYSPALFSDLCLTSPNLKELSARFMEAKSTNVRLMALTEGVDTKGRTVAPSQSMEKFQVGGGRVEELTDSNHSETCKPIDKKHPAYHLLFGFIREILIQGKAVQDASGDKLPAGDTVAFRMN